MTEVMTADAARRLGLSQERVSQMLRSGELVGRRISARVWLVDLGSVGERARVATRRWPALVREPGAIGHRCAVEREATDPKTRALIRTTETDLLWRKLAQPVTVRRFTARHPDIVRHALTLTGETVIEVLGERLVGQSDTVHGYVREGDLEDLVDDAGLVEHGDGEVAVHTFRSGSHSWMTGATAPRALVAVDCARSGASRVRSIGVRALDGMRQAWLARNT